MVIIPQNQRGTNFNRSIPVDIKGTSHIKLSIWHQGRDPGKRRLAGTAALPENIGAPGRLSRKMQLNQKTRQQQGSSQANTKYMSSLNSLFDVLAAWHIHIINCLKN